MHEEDEVHLDKQDNDELFLMLNEIQEELVEIKNMLSLILAQLKR